MQDLSLLNKKCLANMPMLLDTLATTLGELKVLFSPIYDNIKEFMEENSFSCTDKKKIEGLSLFTDDSKRRLVNLLPYAEINYDLYADRKIKRTFKNLLIRFGYICDDGQIYSVSQNVIYFQLIDNSEKAFLKSELQEELKQDVPTKWRVDFSEDSIWIEFDVDETLCVEKINQLAEDFKQYILKPVFDN